MNNNPTNYAQWCKMFDTIEKWEIGHTDNTIIQAIENGSLDWTSGVAERFTQKLLNLINSRLDKLEKFYNTRIRLCYDQFNLTNLLILFKKELVFLKNLSGMQVLPDDISGDIEDEIVSFAKDIQDNLLQGANKDLSGNLKRIVLGTRIDNI